MLPEGVMIMDKELTKIHYSNPASKKILIKRPTRIGESTYSAISAATDITNSPYHQIINMNNDDFLVKILTITLTALTDSGKKVKVEFLDFIKNLKEKRFISVKIVGTSKMQADIQRIMIHTRRKVLIFIQDTTIIRMQEEESASS
jgi:hypothetical protein